MTVERAEATSHGPHGVHARVRGHELTTDRPAEMGGEDQGLMASEHVLVALASCMCTTTRKVAAKRRVPVDGLDAVAELTIADDRGEITAIRLALDVHSPAPEADVRKVVDLAKRACTISKLLKVDVECEVKVHS